MEGCAFANFGNSSGTEGESRHEMYWDKNYKSNLNVTVLGAETVDGPKKVKEGAVVVLLYWCYCFGCSDS